MKMFVYIVDARTDCFRGDGAALQRLHLRGIVNAHLVMDIGYLLRSACLVRHSDIVVTQTVRLRLRQAARDTESRDQRNRYGQMVFKILQRIVR